MLPRSYTAHSLEFLIHGLRDSLSQNPDEPTARRYRAMLARAEAELSELKSLMGEQDARDKSVDGRGARRAGPYVAGRFKRFANRKGSRNG